MSSIALTGSLRLAYTYGRADIKVLSSGLILALSGHQGLSYVYGRASVIELSSDPGPAEAQAQVSARSLHGRAEVYALEISHSSLPTPVRVVNDNSDHLAEGNLFIACAFSATLPQEVDGEVRRASIRLDNVGKPLMKWVTASRGGEGAQMRILTLIPSVVAGERTSFVVFDVSMSVAVAEITNEYVSIELTDDSMIHTPGILLRHDPGISPGLF